MVCSTQITSAEGRVLALGWDGEDRRSGGRARTCRRRDERSCGTLRRHTTTRRRRLACSRLSARRPQRKPGNSSSSSRARVYRSHPTMVLHVFVRALRSMYRLAGRARPAARRATLTMPRTTPKRGSEEAPHRTTRTSSLLPLVLVVLAVAACHVEAPSPVPPAVWPAKTYYRTADVRGRRIFYREAGAPDRPTLLLLHGYPSSSPR